MMLFLLYFDIRIVRLFHRTILVYQMFGALKRGFVKKITFF